MQSHATDLHNIRHLKHFANQCYNYSDKNKWSIYFNGTSSDDQSDKLPLFLLYFISPHTTTDNPATLSLLETDDLSHAKVKRLCNFVYSLQLC